MSDPKFRCAFDQEIIDSMPDEMLIIDPKNKKVLMANKIFYQKHKFNKKDIIGKYCFSLLHDTRIMCKSCPMKETLKSGKTKRSEHTHFYNNEKTYCAVTTTPIKDDNGKIIQILHISRDITKRKIAEESLRESEEKFRNLVKNAPLGIMSVDIDGRIIDINSSLLKILGSPSITATKRINVLKFKPLIESGITANFKYCMKHGKSRVAEQDYTSKWGKKAFIRYHLQPQFDKEGKIRGVQAIVEDISKRKKAEQDLRQKNTNLLSLFQTSTDLQHTMDITEIVDIAIKSFTSLNYDRVRFYLMENGLLRGIKANYIDDKKFQKKVIQANTDYPKTFEAITRREPIILTDLTNDYPGIEKRYGVKHTASLPLLSKEKVIGIISIDNKFSKNPILKQDLNLLMTFANQIAVAIENGLLYKEIQKKLHTLSALYDISSALSGTLDLEKILNLIVIKIVKLLKADLCSILLLDDSKKILIPKTVYDIRGEYPLDALVKVDETVTGQVSKNLKHRYISDLSKEKSFLTKKYIRKEGLVSMLSLPLTFENLPIGVINIYTKKPRVFSSEELDLLRSLSNQAAIIIENSKLYSTIKDDKFNLTKLVETSQAINSTLDRERLQEIILNNTVEFTNADYGFLMLIKDEYLNVKLSKGFERERAEKLRIKIGEGIPGHVAKTGRPVIVNDVSKDKRYISVFPETKSEAVIPLITQNKVIGVLNLESTRLRNFKRMQKTLNILTNQIAIAIENAGLYDEIRNFNKRLKNEIELATKELREKNIELRKMDQMKSEFVSNVSHELRTPLTSITGYTKLMLMEKLGNTNDRQRNGLRIISEEGDRLTRLINNVLDLSKLESGKIKFRLEKIDILEIAEKSIQTLKNSAIEKNIILTLHKHGRFTKFKASKDLLKQVFINLLNNALKFTGKNGKIDVILKRKKNEVEVCVKDTGKGVPKNLIPKLFDKFYQVDTSMTRKHGGTGLGLVIVKHIVDAHKGNIKVKSELGKGSEFIFTLPLRK